MSYDSWGVSRKKIFDDDKNGTFFQAEACVTCLADVVVVVTLVVGPLV